MAFCAFDDSAALFDSTPVENMFITEYMLRAPGDFVKVYLYALMLCYHPTPRMSLSSMARDLDMTEEDVERAFKYWARDGLVRQDWRQSREFHAVQFETADADTGGKSGGQAVQSKVH